MNSITAFLAIAGSISLGAISPGASFLYIAQLAANKRSLAIRATLGLALGGALYGLLAIWGLAKIVINNPIAMNSLRALGGAFLCYLGVSLWLGATKPLVSVSKTKRTAPLLTGFVTQVSNPKTIVIYVSVYGALLPASPEGWLYYALPATMFVIEGVWYTIVSLALSSERSRAVYLRAKSTLDRLAGAVLGLIGASFFVAIWG